MRRPTPGKINVAWAGVGSPSHITGELFMSTDTV